MNEVEVAFIGGSGLYKVPGLKNYKWVKVSSYFGLPSNKICIGTLNGKNIAFLPRHGIDHNLAPSSINYRANIDALKKINVKNIISISAVGSLREDFTPGDIVLVDQYIDRTCKRESSFFDTDIIAHVEFSKPVCQNLTNISEKILKKIGYKFHLGGTYVCIEGPQFSTLAESNLYRSWGCDVIGMTNLPEAKLAREAGICYLSLCMITDYDCWHPDHENVSVNKIIKVLNENNAKGLSFINEFTKEKVIICNINSHSVLKDAIISNLSKAPKERLKKLENIIPKK